MTYPTGRRLWLDLRRRGVQLMADAGRLRFDAPAGAVDESIKAAMRERKAELLAIAAGDYLTAAMHLLRTIPADARRAEYVSDFDQHVAERQEAGQEINAAHRSAYIHLAKDLEWDCPSKRESAGVQPEAA